MYSGVFIDESVASFVHLDGKSGIKAVVATDPGELIQKILSAKKKQDKGLLVIIPPKKIKETTALFQSHKTDNVLFRLVIIAGAKSKPDILPRDCADIAEFRTTAYSRREFQFMVEKNLSLLKAGFQKKKKETDNYLELLDTYRDQEGLIAIGRALSIEKNIDNLFRKILSLSRKITEADAGTIYIVEEKKSGEKQIRVKYSDTFSKEISFEESVLPYNTQTIAGYVAITGNVLNIPDVYKLTAQDPVSFNPRFDQDHDYHTKSMLVVPMRNHFDEIIGVIQLINSKENFYAASEQGRDPSNILLKGPNDYKNFVVPFQKRYDNLLEAVAGQAAIAIENARMLNQIQHQFEEFVKASVFAIESRDEATSGHSFRVAAMCVKTAEAINRRTKGPFKNTEFSEIQKKELEYAALLHDYGKVYLDLRVFKKAKKLYEEDFQALMHKIEIAFRHAEIKSLAQEVELLKATAAPGENSGRLRELAEEREQNRRQIREVRDKISILNEPKVFASDPQKIIGEITAILTSFACNDIDGNAIELFGAREKSCLEITRGSLNSDERKQIESHVEHTYNFVSKIPWPKELERIPEIARAHHEFLNGAGYPRRLKGKEHIPLESRMMVIADIFDALTASDRPYKKAIPVEKALTILKQAADAGEIDEDLFELFRQERVWEQ
jgi:HD-GYP domain-containing protein (c-di-GMP phosphodiesterase class II)